MISNCLSKSNHVHETSHLRGKRGIAKAARKDQHAKNKTGLSNPQKHVIDLSHEDVFRFPE